MEPELRDETNEKGLAVWRDGGERIGTEPVRQRQLAAVAFDPQEPGVARPAARSRQIHQCAAVGICKRRPGRGNTDVRNHRLRVTRKLEAIEIERRGPQAVVSPEYEMSRRHVATVRTTRKAPPPLATALPNRDLPLRLRVESREDHTLAVGQCLRVAMRQRVVVAGDRQQFTTTGRRHAKQADARRVGSDNHVPHRIRRHPARCGGELRRQLYRGPSGQANLVQALVAHEADPLTARPCSRLLREFGAGYRLRFERVERTQKQLPLHVAICRINDRAPIARDGQAAQLLVLRQVDLQAVDQRRSPQPSLE